MWQVYAYAAAICRMASLDSPTSLRHYTSLLESLGMVHVKLADMRKFTRSEAAAASTVPTDVHIS